MSEKATIASWKTKPLPEQTARLDYQAQFSAQEFDQISTGLIPQEMEDKWFIVLDGRTLKLYRSWSGNCIYQVEFAQEGYHYHVSRAIVNRNPAQYLETDNTYDAQLLNFLIRHLLLGQDVPFPMPYKVPKELPGGAFQHHVSSTASREVRSKRGKRKLKREFFAVDEYGRSYFRGTMVALVLLLSTIFVPDLHWLLPLSLLWILLALLGPAKLLWDSFRAENNSIGAPSMPEDMKRGFALFLLFSSCLIIFMTLSRTSSDPLQTAGTISLAAAMLYSSWRIFSGK
jgi:hypothetical protein